MKILLFLHIIGAIATGGVILCVWFSILKKWQRANSLLTLLSLLTLFEVISGSLLFIINNGSLALFCARIGIYTTVIGISMAAALIKQKTILEPLRVHVISGATSVVTIVFTLLYSIL